MPVTVTSIPKVLVDAMGAFPALVTELTKVFQAGLPSLELTGSDTQLGPKAQADKLKKLEKAATPALQFAIALAVEGGDTNLAQDLVDHFTHQEDGVPAPDDKFSELLITQEQLTAATRPLGIIVQLYQDNVKLSRADVTTCKTFTALVGLVLGTASKRLLL